MTMVKVMMKMFIVWGFSYKLSYCLRERRSRTSRSRWTPSCSTWRRWGQRWDEDGSVKMMMTMLMNKMRTLSRRVFLGCGWMHVEGERCNQSDLRKKGEQISMKAKHLTCHTMKMKNWNLFPQWHALTREEQAKYYEQVRNYCNTWIIIIDNNGGKISLYFNRKFIKQIKRIEKDQNIKREKILIFSHFQARKERQLHMQVRKLTLRYFENYSFWNIF